MSIDFNEALELQKKAKDSLASLKDRIAKTGWTDEARTAAAAARAHKTLADAHSNAAEKFRSSGDHVAASNHDNIAAQHQDVSDRYQQAADDLRSGNREKGRETMVAAARTPIHRGGGY